MLAVVVILLLCSLQVFAAHGSAGTDWGGNNEDSRRNNQRSREPPSQFERKKRQGDIINPSLFNPEWKPDEYYGVRSEAIISITNKGKYPDFVHREHSYGVRIQAKLVLTLCSVVTYLHNAAEHITAWVHVKAKFPLFKCKPEDITLKSMNPEVTTTQPIQAREIFIHPKCTSWYEVDVAVIYTGAVIPDSKNVWIHTAENMVFRKNLRSVVAAQAVLGRCTVPVYEEVVRLDKTTGYKAVYPKVHFQHWDGCKPNVCPFWGGPTIEKKQEPDRCNNLMNGTRYCIGWTLPEESLCGLSPGTPVFCDVGYIHGLVGFIANETYLCEPGFWKNAVMVGLVDALAWIRDALMLRYDEHYEKTLPHWMINLRENYTSHMKPRLLPPSPTTQGPEIQFKNFAGHQALSIINVYLGDVFQCRGVLVTHLIAVVPCSCLSTNPYAANKEKFADPDLVQWVDMKDLKVSLMVNGSNPFVSVLHMTLDTECDTHYEEDFGLILLDNSLKGSKLAWVMTGHHEIFKTMLGILPVADNSMGHDCYWMENQTPGDAFFVKHKIRFVHWTQCTYNVCPNDDWRKYRATRCYGPDPSSSYLNKTMFCVESSVPSQPACSLESGTPIFCNVEEARGLTGIITKGMDLNPKPCHEREPDLQTAVFVGIDQFLPQFYEYLWIKEMENHVRDRYIRGRGASSPLFQSSVIGLFIRIRIFIVLKKFYFQI